MPRVHRAPPAKIDLGVNIAGYLLYCLFNIYVETGLEPNRSAIKTFGYSVSGAKISAWVTETPETDIRHRERQRNTFVSRGTSSAAKPQRPPLTGHDISSGFIRIDERVSGYRLGTGDGRGEKSPSLPIPPCLICWTIFLLFPQHTWIVNFCLKVK